MMRRRREEEEEEEEEDARVPWGKARVLTRRVDCIIRLLHSSGRAYVAKVGDDDAAAADDDDAPWKSAPLYDAPPHIPQTVLA